ncbi:MAG TPA: kelch repeat-containing protein [Pseudomonadales bacterium]|nr:kelch repeat-containing protein [Pseudomonadales bacterium]
MAGTWTQLNNRAPDFIDTMLLLPDGTVMATAGNNGSGSGWYRLTPDSHGSYINGTWTTLAAMNYTRLYFSSQVLTNGQVFVAGGEYAPDLFSGPGTTNAEIYNPQLNTWTVLPNTPGLNSFYDSCSEILPSGNVLVAPVTPANYGETLIWNTAGQNWSIGPTLYRGDDQDEASWVKLPDNSILTIDPFGTDSERFIPSLNQWVNDSTVPVSIYDVTNGEMGPAFLLPNGKALFVGGTGNTALYTPSGNTNSGTWTAGPVLPNSMVTADAPGAMEVNGKVLFTLTQTIFGNPTYFYEYDPVANSFTEVNGPSGQTFNEVSYAMRMLDLPDGTVLLSTSSSRLYVYQPGGTPLSAGQPVINNLSTNGDGSYHLTGTLFNGISEGAAYGDDAQMASNYPLVRMTNSVTGVVYYARTINWSSTSVMTSNNIVSTDFVLPNNFPQGVYSLVVTANGNASAPMTFVYSPDTLQISSTNLAFTGPTGGPFTPSSNSLTLTNLGPSSLNWTVGPIASWLSLSRTNGVLASGGSTIVTASLNSSATNLADGIYTNTLLFTNVSDQVVQSRAITLQIIAPQLQLVQNGGFETGNFTGWNLNGDGGTFNFVGNSSDYPEFSPHSGTYAAYMGEVGLNAYLFQTLTTIPGQQYLFSSWVNSPDGVTPNECSIAWNGTTLFDEVNMPVTGWTNLTFMVTATGTSTVIQFGFRDDDSYLGLDDVSVMAVQPLSFKSVSNAGSSINLTWSATSGMIYQLQYSTNLTAGNWLNLGNPITATNSTVTTTDSSLSSPQRFYRVMLVP